MRLNNERNKENELSILSCLFSEFKKKEKTTLKKLMRRKHRSKDMTVAVENH